MEGWSKHAHGFLCIGGAEYFISAVKGAVGRLAGFCRIPCGPKTKVPESDCREPLLEEWKSFADGYEVSNYGQVKSRNGVLVHLRDSAGEPFHVIRGKWYRVKKLVAEYFIPNPDSKRRIRHINGRLFDCRVENLEWY